MKGPTGLERRRERNDLDTGYNPIPNDLKLTLAGSTGWAAEFIFQQIPLLWNSVRLIRILFRHDEEAALIISLPSRED
jgi:hypothetical protein